GHLLLRPAPVLAREREEREEFDAALAACLDGLAHGFNTLAVAGDARQEALLRPAAVAVHDDRDVPRHARDLGDDLGRGLELAHTAIRSFSLSATILSMS